MTIPDGGATQPGGWPGRRRPSMTAWFLTPVVILLFAALFAVFFSPVVGWALGGGTPGIFVARDVDCHHGCHWFGDFMSSDRRLAVRDVQYAGNAPGMKAGTVIGVKDINSVPEYSFSQACGATRHIVDLDLAGGGSGALAIAHIREMDMDGSGPVLAGAPVSAAGLTRRSRRPSRW